MKNEWWIIAPWLIFEKEKWEVFMYFLLVKLMQLGCELHRQLGEATKRYAVGGV